MNTEILEKFQTNYKRLPKKEIQQGGKYF